MKFCSATKNECPWINEKNKCCNYNKDMTNEDICPVILHNWNNRKDEFKLKKEK